MNQQLIEAREKWYSAFIAGDIGAMSEFETESFIVINDFGAQNKKEQLLNISKALADGRWFTPGSRTEDISLEALPLGDFVFIHGQGRTVSENKAAPVILFSELWQKTEGQWRVINLHYTTCRTASVLCKFLAN